jgi:Lipocalin-like domain
MVFLSACDKKSDPTITKEELLTIAKGWVKSDYTVTEIDGNVREQFADLKACEKDDVWFFTIDGKLKVTEGIASCSPPRAEQTVTWSFNSDKTKIILPTGSSGSSVQWDVVELSSTKLRISTIKLSTDPNTKTNTTVYTFVPVV